MFRNNTSYYDNDAQGYSDYNNNSQAPAAENGYESGETGESGEGDYRANVLETNNYIQDIFKAFHMAFANDQLSNLYDIIIPNGYGSGIYNSFSKYITLNGYDYKLRIHRYSSNLPHSYYDIYQVGFGYLDKFSKYKRSPLFNEGYYLGFYITGYYRNYLITIGANSPEGYQYLINLFYNYK